MFPFFVLWDECFAVVYDFPHLGLEGLSGVVLEVRKLLDCMNCSTLFSYCSVGKITLEIPLSACVIMASLSECFVLISRMVLYSICALCVCEGVYCTLVMCWFVLLPISCIRLAVVVGGLLWQFLLRGPEFGASFWVCYIRRI